MQVSSWILRMSSLKFLSSILTNSHRKRLHSVLILLGFRNQSAVFTVREAGGARGFQQRDESERRLHVCFEKQKKMTRKKKLLS